MAVRTTSAALAAHLPVATRRLVDSGDRHERLACPSDVRCALLQRLHNTARTLALACAVGFGAAAAHAEVWGYIDAQGTPHVATQKLDDRYQLFFRGRSSADIVASPKPEEDDGQEKAFRQTALFKRLSTHPNARRYEPLIVLHARQQKIDPALVKALIAVESAFDPEAVSPKGAVGLMQLIPATAQRYGVADDRQRTTAQKLFDPSINIRIGTRYLHDMLALFGGDVSLALAAYNAGEYAVQRYDNAIPPFAETQEFVRLVQQFYALFRPPPELPPPQKPARITIPSRRASP